ncbi:Transcriptional regulator, LysR family [hydrothermal vent metagenome]|uniref:Transcriptional regulator, LysR family n=1 Tax=hydrothermal vent metagenome TaxID=652676 RepID=A0A3B1AI45_9ZZZZ
MDIANLQAFIEVATSGSFSEASETLFLTQPAISKRIASIEAELDALLFDRIGRGIQLTEAGRALLPRAQKILLEIEDSRRAIHNLSNQVGGTLRFATSHHIGLHRLPSVLRQYTKNFPDVELDIQFMDSEQACRSVEQGKLEMAIVTLPLSPAESLDLQQIWIDKLSVIIGKSHPLYKKKRVTLTNLAEHKAILPARGTFTREIIEQAFLEKDLPLDISLASNYLETIKMLVGVGLGWSILPEIMKGSDIKILKVPGLNLIRKLGIVTHARRSLSNAASEMKTCLINQ